MIMQAMKNSEHFIGKIRQLNTLLQKESAVISYTNDDINEYSLRCDVHVLQKKIGSILLYYSPKRNRFKADISSISSNKIYDILAQNIEEIVEKKPKKATEQTAVIAKGLLAYVDGSFSNTVVSYGAVILREGNIVAEFSGKVLDPDYQHARQVAGELMAVGKVIQWCLAQQQNRIAIYYDYEGIEHWVTGKWKAKQLLTQRYRDYVQKSGVSIQWVKVAAHTGDYWNEYVDQLAKQAALL
jgi:ribonuclease HI